MILWMLKNICIYNLYIFNKLHLKQFINIAKKKLYDYIMHFILNINFKLYIK